MFFPIFRSHHTILNIHIILTSKNGEIYTQDLSDFFFLYGTYIFSSIVYRPVFFILNLFN